ncbi:hypothetical protein BDF19DRAFT_407680 [Syncephalis fuscata]|nr:hypothetical protein BDF19DRAFT_407680 [Syncephalis fuscata]
MTVGPRVVGNFKRSVLRDIVIASVLGMVAGGAYRYGYHQPFVAKRDAYYAKLRAEKE